MYIYVDCRQQTVQTRLEYKSFSHYPMYGQFGTRRLNPKQYTIVYILFYKHIKEVKIGNKEK